MSSNLDNDPQYVKDTRGASHGLGRIVIVIFWLMAAWSLYDAFLFLMRNPSVPLGPRLVGIAVAVGYVAAAAALTHNGKRMRILGWSAVGFELVGVLMTSLMELGIPQAQRQLGMWTSFGANYYFAPLIVPAIGLLWLWWSNPRRIVEIAERLDS
ncbi:hypothetical protein QS713_05760 [Gleimia hominis]|uniref:Uncharacterized protein n=1 Tax=Gleimia hominis TaxID=595468 RepID=A0ABU3IBF4_9ACTO|nr:hypothetical protein [Gleimia hominis]MDT3767568.1 hypothetical protein [Gleimia hominis]